MGASLAKQASATAEPGFGTGLLHRTAAHILDGHDVVVITPLGGGPVLDLLAISLKARRCTVLRTTATASGGLDSLFRELAGMGGNGQDATPGSLAMPAPGCDRVVLLIAQAHLLGRAEYSLLERATKAGPLQLVLAGPVDPVAHLDGDLAPFHNRISAFHPLVIEPGTPLAVLVPTTPRMPVPPPLPAAAITVVRGPAPVVRRRGIQWPVGRTRNGWMAAIALSALVSLTGAGLRFGWFGAGPHGAVPAPAAQTEATLPTEAMLLATTPVLTAESAPPFVAQPFVAQPFIAQPFIARTSASFVTLPAPTLEVGLTESSMKPPGVAPQSLGSHSAHRTRPRTPSYQSQVAAR